MFTSNINCIIILDLEGIWCFDDTIVSNGLAGIKWEDLLDMAFLWDLRRMVDGKTNGFILLGW